VLARREYQIMNWQFSPYSIVLFVSAIASTLTVYLATRQRTAAGGTTLAWLMVAITEWSFTAALETASVGVPAKVFFSKVEYLGTVSAPVLYLLFVLEYTRLDKRLTPRKMLLLWLIPAVTLILAATNEWHGLVWSSFTPSANNLLIYGHGAWFWIFAPYEYLMIAVGVIILVWAFIRFPKQFRRQIGILIAGSSMPILGNVIYIAGLSPVPGLDLTPVTFTLSGLILTLGILKFQLFELVPVARDALVESMSDSVLVLDEQNRIVDINPAARQLIGSAANSAIGQPAEFILATWPELISKYKNTLETQAEICLSEEPPNYAELRISPIYSRRGRFTGRLITIRDVTKSKFAKQALERNAQGMAALYEASLEINTQPDLSTLLHALVQRATKLLGTTMGALYLVRPDGKSLDLVISYNLGKDYTGTILQFGEGLSGRVAQKNEAIVVEDYSHWENRAPAYSDIAIKRILGVPLKYKGNVIGVLNVTDDQKTGTFTQEEIRLVSLFADQAAIAIENARLLEEKNKHVEQLGIINRISLAITSGLDMDHVLKTLHEQCQQVAPSDVFYVALYDEASSLINIPLYYEDGQYQAGPSRDVQEHPGTLGNVIQARRTLYLHNLAEADTRSSRITTARLRMPCQSYVGIPLTLRERVIGVMVVQSYKPNAYTEDDLRMLETIALQAAIAIENARLYSEEQRLAIIDELTGVYNYRGLLALGGREIDRARRFNRDLSTLFLDIDGFRNFNNQYSHATGNLVLKAVAKHCLTSMRSVDLVSRFGGDEFVILLPETTIETARKAAERLQTEIASTRVKTKHGELSVTISMGVAQLTDDIPDLGTLIDRANQAEHKAKEKGDGSLLVFGD
jgi:diguanylate cyclase (GGDEF)-like protein/PAS domain S-box-containing protein